MCAPPSDTHSDAPVCCCTLQQPLSGSPGYLPGFPLLAGTQVSGPSGSDPSVTRKAVSRLARGLQLPGPGPAGRCTPSSVYAPTIGWGYNYSSSCTIGLTLTQVCMPWVCGAAGAAQCLGCCLGQLFNPAPQQGGCCCFAFAAAHRHAHVSVCLCLCQLRTLCQSNQPGKVLTDIMGTDWLASLTSEQVGYAAGCGGSVGCCGTLCSRPLHASRQAAA